MSIRIHSLHYYPIKSCRGIDCNTLELVDTGFLYDRHWMLVNADGQFLSQRKYPAMARIQPQIKGDNLQVNAPGQSTLVVPLKRPDDKRIEVQIWDDRCSAAWVSDTADRWFSDVLQTDCKLVFQPPSERRLVTPEYAGDHQIVSFADGFPLLVVSHASISELNRRMDANLDINRFRANIVIEGCDAHAEDDWSRISVGGIDIRLVKACSRCSIPSVDQHSAEINPAVLTTLASYRRRNNKIYVGMNGFHLSNGSLRVGQTVTVDLR